MKELLVTIITNYDMYLDVSLGLNTDPKYNVIRELKKTIRGGKYSIEADMDIFLKFLELRGVDLAK